MSAHAWSAPRGDRADESLRTYSRPPSVRLGHATIHLLTPGEAADEVCALAKYGPRGQLVVTPNISHIALLERSPGLRRAYAQAALVLPDGWPVARAVGLMSSRRQGRVNGTDLVERVVALAAARQLTVAMVGGAGDAAKLCAETLQARNSQLHVVLTDPARAEDLARRPYVDDLLRRIAAARPDILFLGLGAPKQEVFACTNAIEAGVVLAIGSSLELLGGVRKRAPHVWRRAGLEWLHRLLQEPRRLAPRYLRDAPTFIYVVARQVLRRKR